jgi:ABC-type nitrate/sulfonate/bicarbonate transport system substrate-binding protein
MSLDRLTIGFIPLVDAAIPIVAADFGFAEAEGLAIDLVREISWSNIRDRLTLGHFDAAHLLSPVAIATTLGLGTIKVPLAAPMALGLNGNAITLSPALHDELTEHLDGGADPSDPAATGAAFARLVRARRACGTEPPTLGMTFPFSTHNYQLRLWLEAAGVDPDEEARLAVVPPPYMVDALENGHVEGFCVGAPWNSVAVDLGLGRILHLGADLAKRCPEKVLAVRASWLDERPDIASRLVRALQKAAVWCDDPENRVAVAERLGARERLHVRPELILRTLEGRLPSGVGGEVRACETYLMFARDGATRPDRRHARWLHAQMARWGQAPDDAAGSDAAAAVYRPEVFDAATGPRDVAEPEPALGLFNE